MIALLQCQRPDEVAARQTKLVACAPLLLALVGTPAIAGKAAIFAWLRAVYRKIHQKRYARYALAPAQLPPSCADIVHTESDALVRGNQCGVVVNISLEVDA